MSYDDWKTTPPPPRGFNCPKCESDCDDVEPWGLSEMDGRVYRCPECNHVFTEADALSNAEVREDAKDDRDDARREEAALEDCPF